MNRPVILLGNGIRGNPELINYLCSLGIPILTTWMAADFLAEDHPAFCGRPGIYGQRAANIIHQKATHLYCYGARLDEQQVAYRYDNFALNAMKFIWEIDKAEIDKLPDHYYVPIDDVTRAESFSGTIDTAWLSWCKSLYARFRPELEGKPAKADYVDPFRFIAALSDYAQPDDIIISGAGKAGEILCQAFKIKAGQRFQTLSTNGAMGYDIPLSIGACLATGRRVLCVTGDGGFQLNTQELEVIRRLNLPVKFFVFSNGGYASIRQMQILRFNGNVVGADESSGFTIPPLMNLARCYGLKYQQIYQIRKYAVMTGDIIEIPIDPDYMHYPRVATTFVDGKWQQDGMEDMTPKLPADELQEIMEWDG